MVKSTKLIFLFCVLIYVGMSTIISAQDIPDEFQEDWEETSDQFQEDWNNTRDEFFNNFNDMNQSYTWSFFGMGVICIVFSIIWLIISILIAIWVYKDAEKRGNSGILWLLIVFLTGIIGIIVWLVIRPPIGGKKTSSDRRCPGCGRSIPFDAKICPYCGKKFEDHL